MSDILHSTFHHSGDNILGGHDFYDNNNISLGHSESNIFGGQDYYDNHNHVIYHSQPNEHGGMDITDSNNAKIMETQHFGDTESVYGSHHNHIGDIHKSPTGGDFAELNGMHVSWQDNVLGGITMDPMSNVNHIKFPPLL